MDYATAYDVGERKRASGINEDSVAVCVFEDGHRDGLVRPTDDPSDLQTLLAGATDDGGAPEDGEDSEDAADGDADGDRTPSSNRGAAVFALADGAGGYEAGDVASYIASTIVVEELAGLAVRAARSDPSAFDVEIPAPLPDRPTTGDLQGAIAGAIQTAHRRILAYADAAGQPAFTTVVAGIAVDGELHYGWVGDSRAYVVSEAADRIEQLTRDHSVVADLLDAGAIDEVEAHVHPRGNEITAALGGHPGADVESATVGVETHTVPLYGDDVVLVTSDGLVDAQTDAPALHDQYVAADSDEVADRIREAVVTDDDLRATLAAADSLDGAAADMLSMANDRGGKDNLSVVLLRDRSLSPAPAPDRMPTRAINPDEPLEDRQTVILPDE